MDLGTFKKESWSLYQNGAGAEAFFPLVQEYFWNKAIPLVTATPPFVARVRINYNGEVFRHINDLTYNPNPLKISLQRANFDHQQVFYVSPHTDGDIGQCCNTAILETVFESIKKTDVLRMYVTLSRWRAQRPLNVINLSYAENSLKRNRDCSQSHRHYNAILEDFDSQNGKSDTEIHTEALKFISELFCTTNEKPYAYRVTSAYCNYVQNRMLNYGCCLDGILYPSANTEASGLNMALSKSLVDDGILYMDHAVMFSVQRHPTDHKLITFSPASTSAIIRDDGSLCFERIW